MKKNVAVFMLFLVVCITGCVSTPYNSELSEHGHTALKLRDSEEQFEYGRPHAFLDSSGWIWPGSLLGKLFLWNKNIDSHEISDETVDHLKVYLSKNNLTDVKVRVNQYAPGGEWGRLFRNKEIHGFWRYTFGFVSTAFYMMLPQRFFGGDNYNPYTNTISLYSDHPAIALHEAGHSKDSSSRENKGTYAALYILPIVPLYHEAQATNDALSYMSAEEMNPELKSGYKVLYPAYCTYIGGGVAQFLPQPAPIAIQAVAVIPGHIVGRIKASNIPDSEPSVELSHLGDDMSSKD